MTLRLARDDRLARLAASGDTRAFAVIYERYHQPIYRYCHSILHDPDDAADALQNAMIKAMRALEGNERDIALKPWLFRIAHNEAISLVRRRRPAASLDGFEGPHAGSVDEDAATRERLTQLVADLRELPDRQRGALLMRELAGLGFDEIGEIFGVSPAAAKQTVYEARTTLHEYVEGRHMRCEEARQSLSAGDRRMLRGRKLSAHLRDCPSCREFQELMRLRRRDVAALAPPLSASVSAAILQGIAGGGGGGGAGGGGVAWLAGGGAKALLGSEAAKGMLAAALVAASSGALAVVSAVENHGAATSSSAAAEVRDAPAAATTAAAANDSASGTTQQTDRARRRGATRHHGSRSTTGAPRSVTPTSSGGIAVRAPHESGPASAAPHHTAQGSTPIGGGDPGTGVALPAEITQALTTPTPPLPVTVAVAVPAVIGDQPQAPVAAQTP